MFWILRGKMKIKQEKRMKRISFAIIAVILVTALTACTFGAGTATFNGSRTGNDSQFIMKYTVFNTTDSQELKVNAGDTVHAEIVMDKGLLSYKIQKGNDKPIAEGKGISASKAFDVKAEESGIYTVTVIGERAKGSVKFVVERAE